MRLSILFPALFFLFTTPAFADIAIEDTSDPEETEEAEDTGKEDEGGCNTVNIDDITLLLLPIIGLAIVSRRK
jgi:hypothetical protein